MTLSSGPVDCRGTHKSKLNKERIMTITVHGSERVKPNSGFDEDTHSNDWLKI